MSGFISSYLCCIQCGKQAHIASQLVTINTIVPHKIQYDVFKSLSSIHLNCERFSVSKVIVVLVVHTKPMVIHTEKESKTVLNRLEVVNFWPMPETSAVSPDGWWLE